ncbi:MAG TPA: hypothetical protein VHP33_40785 [Polyangiaceae bacterium]|nr:hypothetical protein [Polyangiaceae bacterium]
MSSRRAIKLPSLAAALSLAASASAQQVELPHPPQVPPSELGAASPPRDRFTLSARSETYVQLFRRALLPGPGGSAVTADLASPFTQYLFVQARDVDAPWQRDAVDLELSAWGQLWPTSSGFERPFDGDVQTANVAVRAGPVTLRLGRQLVAGGAARFSRFDGLGATAASGGLYLTAYGGWAVLPRWDQRIGYHQLGKAERELLMDQQVSLSRAEHWLSGARLGYDRGPFSASASFHEQHEAGGLQRRNLGADAGVALGERVDAAGSVLLELDERKLAEARLWLDLRLLDTLSATLEGLRTKPALLLSRQSVFSVFSTGRYDEVGGFARWQALPWLGFDASGYVEVYESGRPGARTEGTARFEVGGTRRTLVRLAYGRVIVENTGYHSVRGSLSRAFDERLRATLEAYGYLYDAPIQGYRASSVYSGTLGYQLSEPFELLWGASVLRSPFARFDAQTLLRVSCTLDAASGRRR